MSQNKGDVSFSTPTMRFFLLTGNQYGLCHNWWLVGNCKTSSRIKNPLGQYMTPVASGVGLFFSGFSIGNLALGFRLTYIYIYTTMYIFCIYLYLYICIYIYTVLVVDYH